MNYLQQTASAYTPKNNLYYAVDEELNEIEDYEELNCFCEDCYDLQLNKLNKLNKLKNIYYLIKESFPEKEDFCSCGSCHEIIDVSNLFTYQELEYWLSLTKSQLVKSINDPRQAYQLNKLMNEGIHYNSENAYILEMKLKEKISLVLK